MILLVAAVIAAIVAVVFLYSVLGVSSEESRDEEEHGDSI